ncbi:hypothetical protein BMS3Bbin15_00734 [archaeon BMS3Bbin15]|nr:hypothetical protein BMS3Bbin15_00734 [archaeon BMS3Bbin15]
MVVLIITFFIGIAYGYFNPGREDRKTMLKKGAYFGIIIGLLFALIISVFEARPGTATLTAIGVLIAVFITIINLTILFIAGTWIGDWIERKRK